MERILQWWKNYRFSIADPPIISMEGLYPLLLLLVLSLLAVFFHLVRILFNAPVDFSMDWNLFLSWIPLMTAFFINNITRRFGHLHVLVIFSSLFWLAFFPNAPYMITDISHLSIDLKRDLTWHDTIMLFCYAEVSLFNGLVSLYWIHQTWRRVFRKSVSTTFLLASLPLAGFGVYLGRVRRMNSWDIIHDPRLILDNLFKSMLDRTALVISLEIGLLLGMLYLVLWAIVRFRVRYNKRDN
ncbi:DUF1361 domain-containing protein [Dyadobacter sp. 3J3]|uniref:DUF1361 domain-containing protein n=1 Tax=Dyadobacter sp. 3J3 TaxID=2606600 RepID=UPI001E5D3780|nr:DUF1361 domain-containing protein [Dyadobacter sp. 3J3]